MSGSLTTVLVTASYILAVVAAIIGFCFSVNRALVRGSDSAVPGAVRT